MGLFRYKYLKYIVMYQTLGVEMTLFHYVFAVIRYDVGVETSLGQSTFSYLLLIRTGMFLNFLGRYHIISNSILLYNIKGPPDVIFSL